MISYDPKENLGSQHKIIEREIFDDDLQPGDQEYYPSLQRVYQQLQHTTRAADASINMTHDAKNLKKCNSMMQIFENMKSTYEQHTQHTGKVLPKDGKQ